MFLCMLFFIIMTSTTLATGIHINYDVSDRDCHGLKLQNALFTAPNGGGDRGGSDGAV